MVSKSIDSAFHDKDCTCTLMQRSLWKNEIFSVTLLREDPLEISSYSSFSIHELTRPFYAAWMRISLLICCVHLLYQERMCITDVQSCQKVFRSVGVNNSWKSTRVASSSLNFAVAASAWSLALWLVYESAQSSHHLLRHQMKRLFMDAYHTLHGQAAAVLVLSFGARAVVQFLL
jgi:hypothetical protein